MSSRTFAIAALLGAALCQPAWADPIKIVAAENFYGDVAKQIGGANVEVISILTNPDTDPHLFEASAETARDLIGANVVIANGAGYDAWMERLIAANKAPGRKEINVGQLVGRRAGDNPHLWYHPGYVKAMAKSLSVALVAIDPEHRSDYAKGEAQFVASLEQIEAKIAEMRKKYAGRPVSASEPVFGYQAELIGLKVHNERFCVGDHEQCRAFGLRGCGIRGRSQRPSCRRDAVQRPGERTRRPTAG